MSEKISVQDAIQQICELAKKWLDPQKIAEIKKRHAAVLSWNEPDYLPILFDVPVPELDEIPSYDWHEQFYEPAKSFIMQMKYVVVMAASGSDYPPAVRADLGVICVPSLFGVQFDVPSHTKPVATRFIPKDVLREFSLPESIQGLGVTDRIVEHTQFHLEALRANGLEGLVGVHLCDTQGPFDIACQVYGHGIFTEMYDDPDFIHHLMEQATAAYIAMTRLCKRLQGEGETWGNASGFWMEPGGVRLCDDSGILLSPNLYKEFALPYHAKALATFGGGWIHYCGGIPDGNRVEGIHLHELYCSIPDLCGFNFSTGHDWPAEVKKSDRP